MGMRLVVMCAMNVIMLLVRLQRAKPNVDLVFKEIFQATRFVSGELNSESWRKFHSVFFKYEHKQQTFVIKRNFNERIITRQFKRALYEVFL